ncbi:MAG TPA: alpha/beta fold hydrolase [Tepidiformaceae bacterium]|nr:alpha/beta fold hydrolase [Tepidiformaceae bacterium]
MTRGVQFATTDDGLCIAYTATGAGYPVFWLPHFLASHVQLEWEFPQRFVYDWLAQRLTVVRFDCRGLGMSDREVEDISLECRFRDLDAVARKLGFDRFALVGIEGGGNLAAAYAATHPDSVSHLVLINWTPRFGDEASGSRLRALGVLLNQDWEMLAENIGGVAFGYNNPLAAGYGRLVRASVSQGMAKRYGAELAREDLLPVLADITSDTLVLHSEKNGFSSEASARTAASRIVNARLVTFEGSLPDHIQKLVQTVGDFIAPAAPQPAETAVPSASPGAAAPLAGLTVREIEILTLLARGLSNREIAEQLTLSHRTIERHLENIYRKTGARNRAEATALAFTHRLLDR